MASNDLPPGDEPVSVIKPQYFTCVITIFRISSRMNTKGENLHATTRFRNAFNPDKNIELTLQINHRLEETHWSYKSNRMIDDIDRAYRHDDRNNHYSFYYLTVEKGKLCLQPFLKTRDFYEVPVFDMTRNNIITDYYELTKAIKYITDAICRNRGKLPSP